VKGRQTLKVILISSSATSSTPSWVMVAPQPRRLVVCRKHGSAVVLSLAELPEQLGLLLRRHAGVGDGELDEVSSVRHLARLERDLPLLALIGVMAGSADAAWQGWSRPVAFPRTRPHTQKVW
jgi:hypothetical protein